MTLWVLFTILLLTVAGVLFVLAQPSFGKQPSGERLERIQRSPLSKHPWDEPVEPSNP